MNEKPKRRWPQFGLQELLVVVFWSSLGFGSFAIYNACSNDQVWKMLVFYNAGFTCLATAIGVFFGRRLNAAILTLGAALLILSLISLFEPARNDDLALILPIVTSIAWGLGILYFVRRHLQRRPDRHS